MSKPSKSVQKELNNLLEIIRLKNMYQYKNGLCIDYTFKDKKKSRRKEHSSLREYVWSYISKPKNAKETLRLLEEELNTSPTVKAETF
jgi:hypothetical protein